MSEHTPVANITISESKPLETADLTAAHEKNDIVDHHEHYLHLLNLPHHRKRTLSECERIATAPCFKGTIESFCRNKGHGFIVPKDGSDKIFVHISDIEGEWCPKPGDIVSYKKSLVPPKMEKYQAVHVKFIHLNEECQHEHWDTTGQTHQ